MRATRKALFVMQRIQSDGLHGVVLETELYNVGETNRCGMSIINCDAFRRVPLLQAR